MARRRKALHITRGADYFYRIDATLDGDPMALPDGAVMLLERGSDAVEITPSTPTTGVWIFPLTDVATAELDEGLWEFKVTTDDDIVIPWQTGHAIVDDRAGEGGDTTQIVGTHDSTAEIIERTGIPIVVDGSGGASQDAIDAEAAAREAGDDSLQVAIEAETSVRTDADTNEAAAREAANDLLIPLAQRGAPGGVATLDLASTVPDGQIASNIVRTAVLTAAVQAAVDALLAGAPSALDTLKELADAIGDDQNFAATVTAALAGKVDKAVLTNDGDLLTRASGAITRITRAALAADSAWASVYVALSDSRLADARSPLAHHASHESGGGDALTLAQSQIIGLASALAALAPLVDAHLTGTPTVPTATAGTNTTQAASTAFVQAALTALLNGAPAALDTLKELADAINDDASFAASVTTALAGKASASLALGGRFAGTLPNPTIPPGSLVDADFSSAAALARTKIAPPAAWTTPSLPTAWHSLHTDFVGFEPVQHRLDPLMERVYLKGTLYARQATANGVVVWTMPTGSRPTSSVLIPTVWFDLSANARKVANIQVQSNGDVSVQADAAVDTGDQIYLGGLTFSLT